MTPTPMPTSDIEARDDDVDIDNEAGGKIDSGMEVVDAAVPATPNVKTPAP